MALEVAHHRSDLLDGGAKLVLAHAPLLGPVAGFVILIHVNARTVLSAAYRAIVGHEFPRRVKVDPAIVVTRFHTGNTASTEKPVGVVRRLFRRSRFMRLTAARPSARAARAVPGS